jgi:hypothetical protein
MSTKETYVQKFEAQLKEWQGQIDAWRKKAEEAAGQASADAKVEMNKLVEQLRTQEAEAKKKLDAVRAAGAEQWESLKTGVDQAWSQLKSVFDKAKSKVS